MQKSFFEYKTRMDSQEKAERLLRPLNLGAPRISHVRDTYLVPESENIEKIYEADGKIFYVVVTPMNGGFLMDQIEIDPQNKEDMLKRRKIEKVMRKTRQVWYIDDLEVVIDRVEFLHGVFIEVQGPNGENTKKFLIDLGIKESAILTKPYNKFQF